MPRTPFRYRLMRRVSITMMALAVVFTLFAVVSLFRGDSFLMHTEVMTSPTGGNTSHQRVIVNNKGRLWFAYVRADVVEESARHEKRWRFYHRAVQKDAGPTRLEAPALLAWLGIDWQTKDRSGFDAEQGLYIYKEWFFTVPYWLIVLPLVGLGWWIGAKPRLLRRRRDRGLCLTCGYDLRETPGLCPECGATPHPPEVAVAGDTAA